MALKRRNVDLSWFTPKQDDAACILQVDDPNSMVIGFIVNTINEKSFARRVPILNGWFGDGRHWFAITRLQRGSTEPTQRWKVLDSLNDEADFVDTDTALLELLCSIVEDGGNIFRATLRIER